MTNERFSIALNLLILIFIVWNSLFRIAGSVSAPSLQVWYKKGKQTLTCINKTFIWKKKLRLIYKYIYLESRLVTPERSAAFPPTFQKTLSFRTHCTRGSRCFLCISFIVLEVLLDFIFFFLIHVIYFPCIPKRTGCSDNLPISSFTKFHFFFQN